MAYTSRMIFLETTVFTRRIKELVDDDQYRELQLRLLANPEAGH